MEHLVFVYGSLKRGFGNHRMLGHDSVLIAKTQTKDKAFHMNSLGAFPAVLRGGNYSIEGELYKVSDDTLQTLDYLEGNGSLYQRELVKLSGNHLGWMYILMPYSGIHNVKNGRVRTTHNKTQIWLQPFNPIESLKNRLYA
jgi:gamma-glutamylcyclotransferase (GGCT)/AIG2-like uncharacterized protein YtfP